MTTQNWIKSEDGSFAITLEEIPFSLVKNSDVPRFSIMWWDKDATNPNATLMDLLNIVAPDPDIPMPITQINTTKNFINTYKDWHTGSKMQQITRKKAFDRNTEKLVFFENKLNVIETALTNLEV